MDVERADHHRRHSAVTMDAVQDLVARSRRAQGLPERVEDPAVLARVSTLLQLMGLRGGARVARLLEQRRKQAEMQGAAARARHRGPPYKETNR